MGWVQRRGLVWVVAEGRKERGVRAVEGEENGRLTRQMMKRATTSATVVDIVAVAAMTTPAIGFSIRPKTKATKTRLRE